MHVLVTGGAGFIGSAVIRHFVLERGWTVTNIDKLTYAANMDALRLVKASPNYNFIRADICDRAAIASALASAQPDAIVHLAAESHVDRSISGSTPFIQSNIVGTHSLLEETRLYLEKCRPSRRDRFKFLHVSTDEVFGTLGPGELFTEQSRYAPRSPYAASKASSDHLVRSWHETYGFPAVITNCSNNYGPFQHSEKFIPTIIKSALRGAQIPIYGDGRQVRDWLYVDDHVRALAAVLRYGDIGTSYNIGGRTALENITVARLVCELLDQYRPADRSYSTLITNVTDRLGHDDRYAIDPSKLENQLWWKAIETLESGLEKTLFWYLANDGKAGSGELPPVP